MADLATTIRLAPENAVVVTKTIERGVAMVYVLGRKDVTIVGPLMLEEAALEKFKRPVVVDGALDLDETQRKALEWANARAST